MCIRDRYMGIAMQCIIQNESSSYAVKEQIIFLASVAAAGIMIFTHYKWLSIWKPEKILVSAVLATVMIYLVPVSYTHLDVYKRQYLQCTTYGIHQ